MSEQLTPNTTAPVAATLTRSALFEELLGAREAGVPEGCLPGSSVELVARAYERAYHVACERSDLTDDQKKTQAAREVQAVIEAFNDLFFFHHEEAV